MDTNKVSNLHCHLKFSLVTALTHIMQICRNFDIANSLRYRAGFAPMVFQWSHSHMAHFSSQICCDFFTVHFFALDTFLSCDFCSAEQFFMLKLVGHCCLFYS